MTVSVKEGTYTMVCYDERYKIGVYYDALALCMCVRIDDGCQPFWFYSDSVTKCIDFYRDHIESKEREANKRSLN